MVSWLVTMVRRNQHTIAGGAELLLEPGFMTQPGQSCLLPPLPLNPPSPPQGQVSRQARRLCDGLVTGCKLDLSEGGVTNPEWRASAEKYAAFLERLPNLTTLVVSCGDSARLMGCLALCGAATHGRVESLSLFLKSPVTLVPTAKEPIPPGFGQLTGQNFPSLVKIGVSSDAVVDAWYLPTCRSTLKTVSCFYERFAASFFLFAWRVVSTDVMGFLP